MPPTAVPLRLRYKVDRDTGCWIWAGATNHDGYGRLRLQRGGIRKEWLAHRWSYESLVGDVPEGMVLDHVCKRKLCVNPDHMEPVTNAENIRRGRTAKLSFSDALRIRSELDRICEQYEISPATLRLIAERRTWKESA